jgi:hypothetical protein
MGDRPDRQRGVAACHLWWPITFNKTELEMSNESSCLAASTNTVSVFRGGAGTGKSFVFAKWSSKFDRRSARVVLAPQRQQVVDMEKAGPSPSTIANFLLKREPSNTRSSSWTRRARLADAKWKS